MAEEMNWSFLFKSADPDNENAAYSKGWLRVGTLGYGGDFVVGSGQLGFLGGTGLNVRINGEIKMKEFLSPDGRAILVNIESSVPILLKAPW